MTGETKIKIITGGIKINMMTGGTKIKMMTGGTKIKIITGEKKIKRMTGGTKIKRNDRWNNNKKTSPTTKVLDRPAFRTKCGHNFGAVSVEYLFAEARCLVVRV